jgi:hypothetical protein
MTDPSAICSVDDDAPPVGTAIVRPLRHVNAVRQRHVEQLADRAAGEESRSARTWGWALGETSVAPVTDELTTVPPNKAEIEAEIAEADERRLRGDRENRADGAATILRWLIGEDDHVPVRGPNPGGLVGGFDDVVRSPDQIAAAIARLTDSIMSEDYQAGVMATFNWVTDRSSRSPVSETQVALLTMRDLKIERLHAEDLIGRSDYRSGIRSTFWADYGLGVKRTIDWLFGDSTTGPFFYS